MQRPTTAALVAAGAAAVLLGAGCEEKHASSGPAIDAGASLTKYVTEDPKLEKALQAAASAAPQGDNGPPPGGIFAPGAADRRHPKGMPTKLDLVGAGDEPRISISAASGEAARAASYGPAGLEIGMQMGPRMALPTLDLTLALGPTKKKDEGGGPGWLVAEVKRALPAREQYGDLPAGTDKEIATLSGSELRVQMAPGGLEGDAAVQLSKTAKPELERLAQNAIEALVLATVPLPAKPVGVGAQWIAETRMTMAGVDVVAYRAYKVKSITGDRLRLSMDVKGYATSADPPLAGVPKGATLVQIDADAQAEMEVVKGEEIARKSDLQERVVMVFQAPGAKGAAPGPLGDQGDQAQKPPPGSTLTAQIQSQATLVRGEDLRAAMKE